MKVESREGAGGIERRIEAKERTRRRREVRRERGRREVRRRKGDLAAGGAQ